jgi:hypothetical protein
MTEKEVRMGGIPPSGFKLVPATDPQQFVSLAPRWALHGSAMAADWIESDEIRHMISSLVSCTIANGFYILRASATGPPDEIRDETMWSGTDEEPIWITVRFCDSDGKQYVLSFTDSGWNLHAVELLDFPGESQVFLSGEKVDRAFRIADRIIEHATLEDALERIRSVGKRDMFLIPKGSEHPRLPL